MIALTLAMGLAQPGAPADGADEVVVTARRRKCQLAIASQIIGDPEFRRRAAEWRAGRPVTVVVTPSARTRCLAKIMFRLADHGVTRAVFVDRVE